MDIGSIAIVVSLGGVLLTPIWAKLWVGFASNRMQRGTSRTIAVVILSCLTVIAASIGPWVFVATYFGTLRWDALMQTATLLVFGPTVLIQAVCAAVLDRKA